MIKSRVVETIIDLIRSPMGPALVLLAGAAVELTIGRWLRRPGWLTGLALFFVALAGLLWLGLRMQPVVPIYSSPWRPLFQDGANLLWVGDGWNWYISGLTLLLGGLGILLELNNRQTRESAASRSRIQVHLAVHLSVLSGALLFVGSGNLLTTVLMWVVLDFFMLLRTAVRLDAQAGGPARSQWQHNQAKGLSLLGALLLLFALLPAGPNGPGQPLQGGVLPIETVALMLVAAAIRAGVYPFHLWLLPGDRAEVNLAERLLDHMVPVLSGLWLMGWTMGLGAENILLRIEIISIVVLALLGSALTAWTAPDQPTYSTYVLVTSAGVAALAGALAVNQGPGALIWPTTVFAFGGGLWLVGGQVWRHMGWQLPVSVGALALAGVPFTPGFLTQPSLARLLVAGGIFVLLFLVYILAQSMLIATMLRSWEGTWREHDGEIGNAKLARLMFSALALGLPLAVTGFFPATVATLASLPDAIPPMLGTPPSVVAEPPVWVTLALPLMLGITLVWVRPRLWPRLGDLPVSIYRATNLEWLFDAVWWLISQISRIWGRTVNVLEGAGYIGWALVVLLIVYLLR
jgi:hypothetical protein